MPLSSLHKQSLQWPFAPQREWGFTPKAQYSMCALRRLGTLQLEVRSSVPTVTPPEQVQTARYQGE
jgi:hypothetical protein